MESIKQDEVAQRIETIRRQKELTQAELARAFSNSAKRSTSDTGSGANLFFLAISTSFSLI